MTTNEELCERILPFPKLKDVHPEALNAIARDQGYLETALNQGILIPAEKMLTVDEIADCLRGRFIEADERADIANEIHQSSRQKAGVK